MIIKLLAAPVVGAVIGYCTNWLAVKMLFRPRTEKRIFGVRVPFTPGVIPKGKKRLAAAVSDVLNEQLLTQDALEEKLLAPEMKYLVKSTVNERLALIKNDRTVTLEAVLSGALETSEKLKKEGSARKELSAAAEEAAEKITAEHAAVHRHQAAVGDSAALSMTSGEYPVREIVQKLHEISDEISRETEASHRLEKTVNSIKDFLTDRIYGRVKNANLGQIAADTVNHKLAEALAGSFLGSMMGDSITQMMGPAVAQTVDGYIEENGEELIRGMVNGEVDNILDIRAGMLIEKAESGGMDFGEKISQLYSHVVKKSAGDILDIIDFGGIAASAIEDMDNEQLEKIVLATMKTELGAVISLGALIGLVLGLINMIIYLL